MVALTLPAAFLITSAVSELLIRRRSVQGSLARLGAAHVAGLSATVWLLVRDGSLGLFPLVLFWGGAFTAWFGVRVHLESSILFRMLHMLEDHAQSRASLVSAYEARYGGPQRLQQLVRAGFVAIPASGEAVSLTPKGLIVSRIACFLR